MILLIADDHAIFRKGLRNVLENAFNNATIIETKEGEETLKIIQATKPNVAILDIDMPGINGLDICKQIYDKELPVKVIVLTMYNEEEMFNKAMLNGASGYVVKDNSVNEIVACINHVLNGKKYIPPSLYQLNKSYSEIDRKKKEIKEALQKLTQAELKTLKLVSQNKSSKEISELLFVSVKSVENYRSRICKKLELDPRNNSLLLWTLQNKDILNSIKDL
jgi:DNA-binding NarL/FixJ family response regulator